jgi:hypothetical protein
MQSCVRAGMRKVIEVGNSITQGGKKNGEP